MINSICCGWTRNNELRNRGDYVSDWTYILLMFCHLPLCIQSIANYSQIFCWSRSDFDNWGNYILETNKHASSVPSPLPTKTPSSETLNHPQNEALEYLVMESGPLPLPARLLSAGLGYYILILLASQQIFICTHSIFYSLFSSKVTHVSFCDVTVSL